jgi:hypothetical protein
MCEVEIIMCVLLGFLEHQPMLDMNYLEGSWHVTGTQHGWGSCYPQEFSSFPAGQLRSAYST